MVHLPCVIPDTPHAQKTRHTPTAHAHLAPGSCSLTVRCGRATWGHVGVGHAARRHTRRATNTMSQAIPLTNSSQLASRVNQEVRIIGKVQKVCYNSNVGV